MIVFLKFFLGLTLSIIGYQDVKERAVWIVLFPIFTLLGTYLFYNNVEWGYYSLTILINLGIILVVLLTTYICVRFIFHREHFLEALGLGDVFFFIGFALSFPTLTFINFFVFSILFTFVFWKILVWYRPKRHKTIPLAGSMAFFLILVYIIHWTGFYPQIYLL